MGGQIRFAWDVLVAFGEWIGGQEGRGIAWSILAADQQGRPPNATRAKTLNSLRRSAREAGGCKRAASGDLYLNEYDSAMNGGLPFHAKRSINRR